MRTSILGIALLVAFCLRAQSPSDTLKRTSTALSKEIINPSTLLWQVQLEEKLVTKFSNLDGVGQKFRLRMIIPVKEGWLFKVPELLRVIGFFNTIPEHGSGFGDITFNQFWVIGGKGKDWGNWGLGYNLLIPTAKNVNFGSQQWQIGPAFTITFTKLGNWEMYYIVQNFFSISKNDIYGHNINMVFQPNIFYTWENGIYAGIEPLWQYDFKASALDFPLNFRIGYIFKSAKFKYNTYVEPEWKTYRSKDFLGNNEDFSIKFGFRIFLPE